MNNIKPTAAIAATALLSGLVAATSVPAGFYGFASPDMGFGNLRSTFSDPNAVLIGAK